MASAVPVAKATSYNSSVAVTADAMDTTNGNTIDITNVPDQKLAVLVTVSTASAGSSILFKAGSEYTSVGQGDLSISGEATGSFYVTLESARFKGTDGKIAVAFDTPGTLAGTITALAGV